MSSVGTKATMWLNPRLHVFACADSPRALVAMEERGEATGQTGGLPPAGTIQQAMATEGMMAAVMVRQELLGISNRDLPNFLAHNQPIMTAVGSPKDITPQDCRRLLAEHGEVLTKGVDWMGNTTLHWAVERGNGCHTMVPGLLKINSDPNAKNKVGFTPLRVATEKRCLKCAVLLLRFGADPGALCAQGQNPFRALCTSRRKADLDLLEGILDGVGPDVRDKILGAKIKGGVTLLHLAAAEGSPAMCRFLLEQMPSLAGAGTDLGYFTPLQTAVLELRADIVVMLAGPYSAHAAPPPDPWVSPLATLFSAWYQYPEVSSRVAGGGAPMAILRALVEECRVRLDAREERGCTALHYAALCGSEMVGCVKYLLERGADPTVKCEVMFVKKKPFYDITPAHVALENGQRELYQVLFRAEMNFRKGKGDRKAADAPAVKPGEPAANALDESKKDGVDEKKEEEEEEEEDDDDDEDEEEEEGEGKGNAKSVAARAREAVRNKLEKLGCGC